MPKKDISEEMDCNPWKMTKTSWVLLVLFVFLGIIFLFVFFNQGQKNISTPFVADFPQQTNPPIEETLKKASSTANPQKLEKIRKETMDGLTSR